MKTRQKIYLIGNAFGSYRARVLLEHAMASPKYAIHYTDSHFFSFEGGALLSLFSKISRALDRWLNLYKLAIADIVFVLPMGKVNTVEGVLINFLRKRVISEFYISKYDTYVNDREEISKSSIAAKKLMQLDQKLIEISDQIIFLNRAERDYYLQLANKKSAINKSVCIPLATNAMEKALLPYGNRKTDEITLCWWGSFLPLHGVDKIIEAARLLKQFNVNYRLFLFGVSDERSHAFREQIKTLCLDEKVIIDTTKNFSDRSLEYFLAQHCDIAFGNFGESVKARTVMVNKVVEASSLGLPVISQKTLGLAQYFKCGENIEFCEPEPREIAQKVMELAANPNQMKAIANSSHKLYKQHFSGEAYLQGVMNVLMANK